MNFFDGVMAVLFVLGLVTNIVSENYTAAIWVVTAAIWWAQSIAYRTGVW